MFKSSRLIFLTLVLVLSLVTFVGTALAEDADVAQLEVTVSAYNSGGMSELTEVTDPVTGDSVYYTYSNLVFLTIDIDNSEGTSEVSKITVDKKIVPEDETDTFIILPKTGENNVNVKVDFEDGSSLAQQFKMFYFNESVPANTTYFLTVPPSGQITNVFDGSIKLYFPKNTYVMDSVSPADSQYIMMVAKSDPSGDLESGDTYKAPNAPAFDVKSVAIEDDDVDINDDNTLSSEGTITLSYDSQILRPEILTVYYYDGDSAWKNIGGKVDIGKKTISAPFKGFGEYVVAQRTNNFSEFIGAGSDDEISWVKQYVDVLYAKGYMEPRDGAAVDGSFGLKQGENEANATRLGFAKAIVNGLNLTLAENANPPEGLAASETIIDPDSDSSGDEYYCWSSKENPYTKFTSEDKQIMKTAFINGILQGIVDNSDGKRYFDGNGPLTRAQAAVVLARVLNLKLETDQTKVVSQLKKTFADADGIEAWAAPAALAVSKARIFTNKDFEPEGNLTYAQMAKVVYVMLQRAGKL